MTAVFTKYTSQNSINNIIVPELLVGETVSTAILQQISPTTLPALLITVQSTSLDTVTIELAAGQNETTYGFLLVVTTSSARTIQVRGAVYVTSDVSVPFTSQDPYSFQSILGSIETGQAGIAKGYFVLGAGTTGAHAGYVRWSVLANDGTIFSTGNAYEYVVTQNSFMDAVEATSVIHVPSDIPPTSDSSAYQIRWELILPNTDPIYLFENLTVLGGSSVPLGAQDIVEMYGDPANLYLVLNKLYDSVLAEVYSGVTKVVSLTPTGKPTKVSSGYLYQITLDTSTIPASLDPLTVTWKYLNAAAPHVVSRETAKLFVVNPPILTAIEDSRMQVSKARTTLFGYEDAIFDTATILSWLRRGRDDFNAAGGLFTTFDMSIASGALRSYWLMYSEIAMLRAQSLAEGEKAFNFSGQAISLEVDRTAYYDKLADSLQSQVDSNIGPLKKNLAMKGITSGNGDLNSVHGGNRPMLGISIHPATNINRYGWR